MKFLLLFIANSVVLVVALIILFVAPFWAIAMLSFALLPAIIAKRKGLSFGLWYAYGFFLSIIALVHSILAWPSKTRACPWCGGLTVPGAVLCMRCGRDVRDRPPPSIDRKPAPPASMRRQTLSMRRRISMSLALCLIAAGAFGLLYAIYLSYFGGGSSAGGFLSLICVPVGAVGVVWLWDDIRISKMSLEDAAELAFTGSRIGRALHQHTQDFFSSKTIFGNCSPDQKQRITEAFGNIIAEILQVPNPLVVDVDYEHFEIGVDRLKLREKLAEMTYAYAELAVLCFVPEEMSNLNYGPYVSGELSQHIHRCARHSTELNRELSKDPYITAQELIEIRDARIAILRYFLDGLNLVRIEYGDYETVPEKDWLRPFTVSALICCENTYRKEIGLPSLLPDPYDAVKHFMFTSWVVDGAKNPLFEWEAHHQQVHAEAIHGHT
jgi:hypothetical protein